MKIISKVEAIKKLVNAVSTEENKIFIITDNVAKLDQRHGDIIDCMPVILNGKTFIYDEMPTFNNITIYEREYSTIEDIKYEGIIKTIMYPMSKLQDI